VVITEKGHMHRPKGTKRDISSGQKEIRKDLSTGQGQLAVSQEEMKMDMCVSQHKLAGCQEQLTSERSAIKADTVYSEKKLQTRSTEMEGPMSMV
jgi:hypothetical protein